MKIHRLRKNNQLVRIIGKVDNERSYVLFPFEVKTNKGNWGAVQVVRNNNLLEDDRPYGGSSEEPLQLGT